MLPLLSVVLLCAANIGVLVILALVRKIAAQADRNSSSVAHIETSQRESVAALRDILAEVRSVTRSDS